VVDNTTTKSSQQSFCNEPITEMTEDWEGGKADEKFAGPQETSMISHNATEKPGEESGTIKVTVISSTKPTDMEGKADAGSHTIKLSLPLQQSAEGYVVFKPILDKPMHEKIQEWEAGKTDQKVDKARDVPSIRGREAKEKASEGFGKN